MEGIFGIRPTIKKLDFAKRGKIGIILDDGRQVICPLSLYPSIKKLKESDRQKYKIIKGQILMFDAIDEIYHLQNFLGLQQEYEYQG